MVKKTYAEYVKRAEVMTAGLLNNATQAAKRGLDKVFITKMQTDLKKVIALNNEQEKLKADLKKKTSELEAKMLELNTSVSQARKIVKIDFPKSQWLEFGIEAKN